MHSHQSRSTKRKEAIRGCIERLGLPILLDELRWNVFEEEVGSQVAASDIITDSYKKSFNRTLREHYEGVRSFGLLRPDVLPAGITTRAAAFRMEHRTCTHEFLSSHNSICSVIILNKIRQELAYQSPENRSFVFMRFHIDYKNAPPHIHEIKIPVNLPIILISQERPTAGDVLAIARRASWAIRLIGGRPLIDPSECINSFSNYKSVIKIK